MLVLAAGTITIALNGGLFEKAAEAGRKMQNVMEEEQNLTNGRVKIAGVWYDSIDDYIEDNPSSNQFDGEPPKFGDKLEHSEVLELLGITSGGGSYEQK